MGSDPRRDRFCLGCYNAGVVMLRGCLCLVSAAVLACGGRYHGDSTADAQPGGQPSGVGATAATGGSAAGAGAASSTAGAQSLGFQPFPIATESGTGSPVEAPGWVDYDWSAEAPSAAFEICEHGWTLEEALAKVDELDLVLGYSRLVDGYELAACAGMSPDPDRCFERLIHFFPLPEGTTGGVALRRSPSELLIYYFRIEPNCSLQRLGEYFESFSTPSCDEFGMYPLWGIPPISDARRQCRPTNGLYSFEAVVTEDSCGVTAARFTGVLGFTQQDGESGSLWFPQLADNLGISQGYNVYIREGQAYASGGDRNACQFGESTITLDLGSKLSITNERKVCDDAGERVCTWSMESTRITGPF